MDESKERTSDMRINLFQLLRLIVNVLTSEWRGTVKLALFTVKFCQILFCENFRCIKSLTLAILVNSKVARNTGNVEYSEKKLILN